jgi:hypothetical protein
MKLLCGIHGAVEEGDEGRPMGGDQPGFELITPVVGGGYVRIRITQRVKNH